MTTRIFKRIIRATFRIGLLLAFTVLALKGCDRALLREEYKTCLQIPVEIREDETCEQFNPDNFKWWGD